MGARIWLGLAIALAPLAPLEAKPKPKSGKVDLAPTIAALGGAQVEAASTAADQLGASTDPAAHVALLDALGFGLPPPVAVSALTALAQHPAPPDVAAVKRYAGHRNPMVRSAAYGALALYPDPLARKALVVGLHDMAGSVRGSAAAAIGKGHVREASDTLFELLARGEEPAAKALAAMADVELARRIGDQLGKVPDALLVQTLALLLRRSDFGPDPARVDLVRALGKIQDPAALVALTGYLATAPKGESRDEAQKMVDARGGGK